MFYATLDTEQGYTINLFADIHAFETMDDVHEYLRQGMWLDENEELVVVPGDFSDCWLKYIPELVGEDVLPFTLDQMSLARPGEHPGGEMNWATPKETVYVANVVRHT